MPTEDVKLLAGKIDGLVTRVTTLEKAVTALITKAVNHDKVFRWLKATGILLLGLGLGSGAVKLDDILVLM